MRYDEFDVREFIDARELLGQRQQLVARVGHAVEQEHDRGSGVVRHNSVQREAGDGL